MADKRYVLARCNFQTEIIQHRLIFFVVEIYILEFNGPAHVANRLVVDLLYVWFGVDQRKNTLRGR